MANTMPIARLESLQAFPRNEKNIQTNRATATALIRQHWVAVTPRRIPARILVSIAMRPRMAWSFAPYSSLQCCCPLTARPHGDITQANDPLFGVLAYGLADKLALLELARASAPCTAGC
jgi:hypothetical protein